jgi:type IV pilus assembly protein PilM
MAKRVTTLFIRDTSINLLVMKGEQVEKWASLPLEPGLVSQGLILDGEQVADKVKQVFKETGANTSKVITALSGDDSLYRIITLPELPEAVFPEAIKREVKRTIPTPLEDIYYSYQHLPFVMRGESRVFLVTFPRNLADALVRTLRRAGIKPHIMDLAPLALSRIPNEPRVVIVNARLDHLDVAVIADRLPQVIRRLSLPGETESLEDRLPLIAEEFNRTVAFYNSSHVENPIDATVPVFVCGDLVEEPEAWQSVVGGAGYKVSALSSPVESPEGFNPNEFMVNIGLALKELQAEKEGGNFSIVNLNALPESYVPPRFSMARVLLPVVTVVGIGLLVVAVILILTNRNELADLDSQLGIVQGDVSDLQKEATMLEKGAESAGNLNDGLILQLTGMERGRAMFHEDLTEIKGLAGDQIVLNSISHSGGSVAISGTTSNEDAIFRYAEKLRASAVPVTSELRFSKVWINSISGSGSTYRFQFSLTK